jgi:hypothetical protein
MSTDYNSIINDLKAHNYYIALLDGTKCPDVDSFIIEIAKPFKFPDYYGKNMGALDECLNDLSWLGKDNYALIIQHSEKFLSKSSTDDNSYIFSFLKETRNSRGNVPNFPNDIYRKKSDFRVYLITDNQCYRNQ